MSEGSEPQPRRSNRIFAKLPVRLAVSGARAAHYVFTVDLSPLGARVWAHVPLAPGETIHFFPLADHSYSVPGRIVWVAPWQIRGGREVGVEFLEPLGSS